MGSTEVNDKRLTIVMAGVVAVAMAGIFFVLPRIGGHQNTEPESMRTYRLYRAAVFVDPDTGCEYLQASSGSFTPRLENQGKHRGCK